MRCADILAIHSKLTRETIAQTPCPFEFRPECAEIRHDQRTTIAHRHVDVGQAAFGTIAIAKDHRIKRSKAERAIPVGCVKPGAIKLDPARHRSGQPIGKVNDHLSRGEIGGLRIADRKIGDHLTRRADGDDLVARIKPVFGERFVDEISGNPLAREPHEGERDNQHHKRYNRHAIKPAARPHQPRSVCLITIGMIIGLRLVHHPPQLPATSRQRCAKATKPLRSPPKARKVAQHNFLQIFGEAQIAAI